MNRVEDMNVIKQGRENNANHKKWATAKKKNLIMRSPWHVPTNEINLLKASDGRITKEAKLKKPSMLLMPGHVTLQKRSVTTEIKDFSLNPAPMKDW